MRTDRSLLAGVSLVCFANLLLEVVITRLFSATMFYHFTFLAIALALLGVAASGVYVYIDRERIGGDPRRHMATAARWFAATAFLSLVYTMANPMDILVVTGTNAVPVFSSRQFWQLLLLVITTALPFFFSGVVVSLALTCFPRDVGRIYAWDLAGAAGAALLAGVTLGWFGGPTAVLVAIALACLAASLLHRVGRARWVITGGAAALVILNLVAPIVRVPSAKGVDTNTTKFEAWNAFSRVTVDDTRTIKIDASAATHIETLHDLRPGAQAGDISSLAHGLFGGTERTTLVIGPGGGRDVLHALEAGSTSVTGVEVNPIIARDIMQGAYADASGGLYLDPRVHIVVDDGRSFVRRSDEQYDLLQASLVDTWAATAAGAFALTENALYTREAFVDYLEHVTDRGAVTMTRWHTGEAGETARLLLLAASALEAIGVPAGHARDHLFYAIAHGTGLGTLVVKRTAFTADELARLEATVAAADKFEVVVSPHIAAGANQLVTLVDAGPYSALVAAAPEELSPPTDDRPFFFYGKRFRDLAHPTGKMNDPGLWILISLGSVLGLAALFVVLPLVLHWKRQAPAGSAGTGKILGYFGLVGFAFMTLEVALLQRFTLFLGHPSYSLLVILFTLLLTTAAGAVACARLPARRLGTAMAGGGVLLAVLAIAGAYGLPPLIHGLIGQVIAVRIVLTAVFVAPSGLAMGLMIPAIIRLLADADSPLVPWGWGVNGATSVVGTVIATIVAIYAGFTATFLVGAVAYAAAGALGATLAKPGALGAALGATSEREPSGDDA